MVTELLSNEFLVIGTGCSPFIYHLLKFPPAAHKLDASFLCAVSSNGVSSPTTAVLSASLSIEFSFLEQDCSSGEEQQIC